jgi:uncharacterized membrane protein
MILQSHCSEPSSVLKVAVMGGLFGFCPCYDLTALAVIKNWPLGLDLCGYGMGNHGQVACSVNKTWIVKTTLGWF